MLISVGQADVVPALWDPRGGNRLQRNAQRQPSSRHLFLKKVKIMDITSAIRVVMPYGDDDDAFDDHNDDDNEDRGLSFRSHGDRRSRNDDTKSDDKSFMIF